MLAVSSLRSVENEREREFDEFEEFSTSGNLLDSIDFDDIFVGIEVLPMPDLDMYQEQDFLADYVGTEDENENYNNNSASSESNHPAAAPESISGSGSDVGFGSPSLMNQVEEIMSRRAEEESGKSRNSSKKPPGKKKPKVDWTPELHRRFVQAVEQLGLDKAVPSRILEIMGADTLTRHNVASHLQKYRSHRKHLVARESEAAQWRSQRQKMYGGVPAKREVKPWIAPTMGFPPAMPHFRPLHVWGHPSVDQSMMAIWPKHVAHPLPPWPPAAPTFSHVPTTGTPCFPPQLPPPTRFPSMPVAGVPPPAMYKAAPGIGVAAPQTLTKAPSDVLPSKESIDAAIGDVIAKPWLPLPLGLKPPSIDSVMTELQRQGVSKIPQTCS
ncbi:hypothetical protein ACS0TY_017656 [Phlomoides rotata]